MADLTSRDGPLVVLVFNALDSLLDMPEVFRDWLQELPPQR